jgi:probable HAF family extracellular repeat protein
LSTFNLVGGIADGAAGSLREAISAANVNGQDDIINLAAGTYTIGLAGSGEDANVSGDFDLTEAGQTVTVVGAGAGTTFIDAARLDRVFHVFAGVSVSFSGVTITGGSVTGSSVAGDGGGILNMAGALTLTDSALTNNSAQRFGGGIYSTRTGTDVPTLTITNSSFSGNSAFVAGGGIRSETTPTVVPTITITNSTFSGNSSHSGGAIDSISGTMTIADSSLINNAANSGGAISNNGSLQITNSHISDNLAATGSGGIRNGNFGSLTVTDSTISNNSASDTGGGIGVDFLSTTTVTNSTISGNAAGIAGGAIHIFGFSSGNPVATVTLTNSTIYGNSAVSGGGLFTGLNDGTIATDVLVSSKNTIIAGNTATSIDPDVRGTFTSLGNNLIGDVGGAIGFTNGVIGDQVGSSGSPVNPLLGPLQLNGGPTFTHALLPGSPAIDAGSNISAPATDQRGALRPQDGDTDTIAIVDIGSFEFIPLVPAANVPPVVANAITDVTVDKNAPDTVLSVGRVFDNLDALSKGDVLTLSISSNSNTSLVTASLLAPTLRLDYQPDQIGTADITVRATDLEGAFVEDTFSVTVNVGSASFFTGLGDLPGGAFESFARHVSADGSVVVGQGHSALGEEAFRWTSGTGMVGLGDLSGGDFDSFAFGVSGDGSVVVGEGTSASGDEAFRWTLGTGMVGLGDLPGGVFDSFAIGASDDGSVVVGRSTSAAGREAFRWTSGTGLVGLGDLPGGSFRSDASAVSADGSFVVGRGESASGQEAFRWTSGTDMVGLGDLPGGSFFSDAEDVSADGSVVVGRSLSASGQEAFRWTSGTGMVGLGDLPGGSFSSRARGVSADGSVVVGEGFADLGSEAFIWDDTIGMRNLRSVLVSDFGLDLTGWQLEDAQDVSADGSTIAGIGINPFGNEEAWIVHLALNEPPVANSGGPYSIDEGDSLSLDASGSSDPDGDPLTFSWDVNDDNVFGDAIGETPMLTWSDLMALGIDDNGILTVTVQVDDGQGGVDVASTTLTVDNIAPIATLSNDGPVEEGDTASVSFASQFDPSTADTAAGFVYSYDFDNDGTFEITSSSSPSEAVPDSFLVPLPGTRTVRGRIEDKDGGFTDLTTTIILNHDGDGIFNDVDPLPTTFSNDFSDVALGGTTAGTITDRGDQTLRIEDAADANNGVLFTADAAGGAVPATVSVCGGTGEFSLDAGDQIIVTCGSVSMQVVSGPVQATFLADDGTVATSDVNEGNSLTFEPTTNTFSAPSTNVETVIVLIDGTPLPLDPGATGFWIGIDIKPGSDRNSINLGSKGSVPVAIFSTDTFDATTVDPTTVTLADAAVKLKGRGTPQASAEDVNGDGLLDLVVHVSTEALQLTEGDIEAVLEGETFDGVLIRGSDSVHIVAALHVAGGTGTAGSFDGLSQRSWPSVFDHAVSFWASTGLNSHGLSLLSQLNVQITDLPGSLVGLASASSIWIDRDAAGYGWSINTSSAGSVGRVDLLSVVTHELGHVLGLDHDFRHDVMSATLGVGVRQLASSRFHTGPDAGDGTGFVPNVGLNPRFDGLFSLSREGGLPDPFGTTPFASRRGDTTDATSEQDRLFDALVSHGSQLAGLQESNAIDVELSGKDEDSSHFRDLLSTEDLDNLFADVREGLEDEIFWGMTSPE